MRTFIEIINDVANMRWNIIKKESATMADVRQEVEQAIQQAHAEIWGAYDFDFKKVKDFLICPANVSTLPAPAGDIVNIKIQNGTGYLREDLNFDFLKPMEGTPTKFWVEGLQSGNVLNVYPTPTETTELQVRYNTILKARSADGVAKANLKEQDDVLNIQPDYEEPYLNALKNKAMCYLIADNTDENYAPYQLQAEKQINILLQLQGVKTSTYIGVPV